MREQRVLLWMVEEVFLSTRPCSPEHLAIGGEKNKSPQRFTFLMLVRSLELPFLTEGEEMQSHCTWPFM